MIRVIISSCLFLFSSSGFSQDFEANQERLEKAMRGITYINSSRFDGNFNKFWREFGNDLLYTSNFGESRPELKQSQYQRQVARARELLLTLRIEHWEAFQQSTFRWKGNAWARFAFYEQWVKIPEINKAVIGRIRSFKSTDFSLNQAEFQELALMMSTEAMLPHQERIAELWSKVITERFIDKRRPDTILLHRGAVFEFLEGIDETGFRQKLFETLLKDGRILGETHELLSNIDRYAALGRKEIADFMEKYIEFVNRLPGRFVAQDIPVLVDRLANSKYAADVLEPILYEIVERGVGFSGVEGLGEYLEKAFSLAAKTATIEQLRTLSLTLRVCIEKKVAGNFDVVQDFWEAIDKFPPEERKGTIAAELGVAACTL